MTFFSACDLRRYSNPPFSAPHLLSLCRTSFAKHAHPLPPQRGHSVSVSVSVSLLLLLQHLSNGSAGRQRAASPQRSASPSVRVPIRARRVCRAADDGEVRHVADAGQRLAAKAVRANVVQVLKRAQLAGCKAFADNLQIVPLPQGQGRGVSTSRRAARRGKMGAGAIVRLASQATGPKGGLRRLRGCRSRCPEFAAASARRP